MQLVGFFYFFFFLNLNRRKIRLLHEYFLGFYGKKQIYAAKQPP